MREINVQVDERSWADPLRLAERVEAVLHDRALLLTMKGTLKTHPGCTHWHYKNGREPGTLELTLWPARRRLWIKVQAGRAAPWIDQLLPALIEDLSHATAR
jgi:hypothetical protein